MKIDFTKTLSVITGGLTDHTATWKSYLEDCPDWKETAVTLTAPLILANIILGVILSRLIGGFSPYSIYSSTFSALFWGLLLAILGFAIAVFVFNFLAGTFKGTSNFSRAFAAVSLAMIPAYLAGIVAAILPGFIGSVIALAGGIISLVFLYRIMPLALGVPDEKRVVHFVVSIIVIVVLNMIVGGVFGFGRTGNMPQEDFSDFSRTDSPRNTSAGAGVFGEMERQGRLMESAGADRFIPPDDGELTESQVIACTKVLKKSRALQEENEAKMQKLAEEIEAKQERGENVSIADMSKVYSGIGQTVGANNAEMEIVKTGGGNWAEHSWVKNQLRTARIQQGEGSDAIAHNYELYKEYEEDIGDL